MLTVNCQSRIYKFRISFDSWSLNICVPNPAVLSWGAWISLVQPSDDLIIARPATLNPVIDWSLPRKALLVLSLCWFVRKANWADAPDYYLITGPIPQHQHIPGFHSIHLCQLSSLSLLWWGGRESPPFQIFGKKLWISQGVRVGVFSNPNFFFSTFYKSSFALEYY